MFAVLIMLRDALVAAALAWVGVALEAREPACASESCQQQSD
jgi:hypothetical protein